MKKINFVPKGWKLYTIQATGKQYVARETSCLFCKYCTDVFWDYTNGIYLVYCALDLDIDIGLSGNCKKYKGEKND